MELQENTSTKTKTISVPEDIPIAERAGYITLIRAEKWWAEKASNNPVFFQEYMTGLPPARHHKMWLANLFHPERKRINIIAPRESAKTTVLVYAMVWAISRNPLGTNLFVSVSSAQAEKRMSMVTSTIRDSDRYKNVFPYIEIDQKKKNTQTEFTVKRTDMEYNVWQSMLQRQGSLKDPTLMVHGRGSKGIIGARVSNWLLLDDIIDGDDLNEASQENVMEYIITTLIPCVQENGRVANIGTRWMIGDIPGRLKANPVWHTIEIPAIKIDEQGNRHSYWEDFWPLWKLDAKKEEMDDDRLFSLMYLNDPQASSEKFFTPESLAQDLPPTLPRFKKVYVTTDQALKENQRADWNVYMAIGIDEADNWYILDMMRFKAPAPEQIQQCAIFADQVAMRYFRLDEIVFENVGLQGALPQILASQRPDLPIQYCTPKGDKDLRARNISNLALNGKLFINQRMNQIEELKTEWLNYGVVSHDDTLDPPGLLFQHIMTGISYVRNRNIKSPFLI